MNVRPMEDALRWQTRTDGTRPDAHDEGNRHFKWLCKGA